MLCENPSDSQIRMGSVSAEGFSVSFVHPARMTPSQRRFRPQPIAILGDGKHRATSLARELDLGAVNLIMCRPPWLYSLARRERADQQLPFLVVSISVFASTNSENPAHLVAEPCRPCEPAEGTCLHYVVPAPLTL